MSITAKPAPRVNSVNKPFFDGCNSEKIYLQKCQNVDCLKYIYFPRVCCPYCGYGDLEWHETSGLGEVATYTIIYRTNHVSFEPEVPYYFIAVKLVEGPIMYSRLIASKDCKTDLVGKKVKACFVQHNADQKLPYFYFV